MDLATLIGLVGGAMLILSAVLFGGNAWMFVNFPGLLIVLGGTLATCFIKFSMKDVVNTIKVVMKAFMFRMDAPEELISRMVGYARIAKKDGLIALDNEKPANEFMAKALRYLSDGFDEGLIGDMLSKDIRLTVQRHATGQSIFKGMGTSAPAFGMIGTLIGLVQMLASMNDPAHIGPSMAVALLTTLYGALIANLVCLPISDKLSMRSQQEQDNRAIIREAAIGISQGVAPVVLEEALKIYLSPKDRARLEHDAKKSKAKKP